MKYQPSQSAKVADLSLKAAVRQMDTARHCAVLWFADMKSRGLYRELGFANMAAYATTELEFSKTRTHDFLRLAAKLERLPVVRKSMASGDLGYTKAVEIIKVATAKTEDKWITEAAKTGRRELAQKVRRVKAKAALRRTSQPTLIADNRTETKLAAEVPIRVNLEMTPEQFARYEALLEKAGALGSDRVEALLAGLEALAAGTSNTATPCEIDTCAKPTRRRVAAPVFQVHVHRCPDCDRTTVQTNRGEIALGKSDTERIACDAIVRKAGRPNRSVIPPSRRAEVLARDRFRCRGAGCSNTRFLEVHHVIPRSIGGGNESTNLVTLCAGCHRLHHQRGVTSAMGVGAGPPLRP